MDVNTVLTRLMNEFRSLPALKMAWSCQLPLQDHGSIPKISPSHYIRELNYSTDERHALLMEQHKSIKFSNCGFKIFVEPSILAFQNYKAGDKLYAVITVRNVDKAMQKITFHMDENGPFFIDENCQRIGKFASGMVSTVAIHFWPEDTADYFHKLVISVNGLRVAIPLLGFGARGILHIPDLIKFGRVPVKHLNKILTPIFNIGSQTARFIASTTGPFEVVPEKGVVLPSDSLNLTVSYTSKSVEHSRGHLWLKYENGEEVHVELEGDAVNQNITLDPTDIEFGDTFIGMVTKAKVKIQNNSSVKVKFHWRNYPSPEYFLQQHQGSGDSNELSLGVNGDHGKSTHNHSHNEDRKKRLYSRGDSLGINKIIQAQKEHGIHCEKQETYFVDEAFRIEPPTGEIQPNSSAELMILFRPTTPKICYSEAYCDIGGLEERIEMRITGRALGPKFKFGFDVLDIGNVCLGGAHTYEVPVTNNSELEGTINFLGFAGLMDNLFSVEPSHMSLGPGEYGAFYLFFNPVKKPVPVFEELNFEVEVTKEIVSVIVKGALKFPEIRFAEEMLQFGEVSYGFPDTRQIVILNDSMFPIDISLSLDLDGTEKVLEAEDIIAAIQEPDYVFPIDPQEFRIEPSQFSLGPRGFQRVAVTITAANYGSYKRALIAKFGEDDVVLKELLIEAECVLPTLIKPATEIVVDCVAGFPTPTSFTIHNPSALSCVYCCVPERSGTIHFSSENFLGIALARESTTIPFQVNPKFKGLSEGKIELFVAGKIEPVMEFIVKCKTVSAVSALKLSKKVVDLGDCKLREKVSGTFKIINSSSIPLPYSISLVKGGKLKEFWEMNPTVGIAEPDLADNTVTASVTLVEAGTYCGIFRIYIPGTNFKDGLELQVTVAGIGCSLVFDPEIDESGQLDFGYLFTNYPTILSFEVTNPGFFIKHLEWKNADDDPPINPNLYNKKKKEMEVIEKPSRKKLMPTRREYSPFEILPMKKVLNGGESMTLTIKALSTVAKTFTSHLTLWAYAEVPKEIDRDFNNRISKANIAFQMAKVKEMDAEEKIYIPFPAQSVTLSAVFSVPKLVFSHHEIEFRIDPNPTDYSDVHQQTVTITAENPFSAELDMIFHTAYPFCIVLEDNRVTNEWKHNFKAHEKVRIPIMFDVSRYSKEKDLNIFSGTLDVVYAIHPKSDESIKLHGILSFPSVTLDIDVVDFEEITNGKEGVLAFNASNLGKYCTSYKIYIVSTSVSMKIVNPPGKDRDSLQELDLIFTSSDHDMYQQLESTRQESVVEEEVMSCMEPNDSFITPSDFRILPTPKFQEESERRSSCKAYKESFRFFYEKLYRMKLMSFLGLKDPEHEPNDELTYFNYFSQKPPVKGGVIATPNEVVDIVPATGLIQAGNKQRFTVAFYAQSNIHFEATICVSIENGASRYLTVKGKSIPPPNPYAYLISDREFKC